MVGSEVRQAIDEVNSGFSRKFVEDDASITASFCADDAAISARKLI